MSKTITMIYVVGFLVLIGVMGYLDRGYFDFLGLGALAMLVIPIVVALRRM